MSDEKLESILWQLRGAKYGLAENISQGKATTEFLKRAFYWFDIAVELSEKTIVEIAQ